MRRQAGPSVGKKHAADAGPKRGGAKGNTPGKRTLIDPSPGPGALAAGPHKPADGASRSVAATAARGFGGTATELPHRPTIQALFGRHDVSGVQAHVGGPAAEASQALGAHAYASGDSVAFGRTPDLHTAAHEAAHVVQQRGGVQLKSGIGEAGDAFERHADAVADRVVAGESAEALLDHVAAGATRTSQAAAPGAPGAPIQRVEIVGTTHNDYRPSQDAVHPDIVALYAEGLRNNRFTRSAAYVRATDTAPRALDDGHHSYVASKRANVDIEIENMGLNDVGPAADWSQVAFRRFLGLEAGDFETAAEALKAWEIQILLRGDSSYQDVWDADEGELRGKLDDISGDAPGQSEEDSEMSEGSASDSSREGADTSQGSSPVPEVTGAQPGAFGGTPTTPMTIAYGPEAYHGYFYLPNYGIGSLVHGYVEQGVIVRTGRTEGGYFEATLSSGRFPQQYQSFTQGQPFVSPIGQRVWLSS